MRQRLAKLTRRVASLQSQLSATHPRKGHGTTHKAADTGADNAQAADPPPDSQYPSAESPEAKSGNAGTGHHPSTHTRGDPQAASLKNKNKHLRAQVKSLRRRLARGDTARRALQRKLDAQPFVSSVSPYPSWHVIGVGHGVAVIAGPGYATKVVKKGQTLWGSRVTRIDADQKRVMTTHGVITGN